MKKFILLTAAAILAGGLLLHLLQRDPGYVLIVAWGKTIEMRLGFALVLLLMAGVLWVFVLRNFKSLLAWLKNAAAKGSQRRERKLNNTAEQGLYLLLQEDAQAGQKRFLQSAKLAKQDAWHYLAAARCALTAGDLHGAEQALVDAETRPNVDALTMDLLRADLAFARAQWQQSLLYLNKAKTLAPHSGAVLKRLLAVYEQLGDWHALATLMPEIERAKIYLTEEWLAIQERIAYTRLGVYGQQLEALPVAERASLAQEIEHYWRHLPKTIVSSPRFIERYVQLLILLQREPQADALIRQTLKNQWYSPLVSLFGALQQVDARQQLQLAEHWEEKHAEDPALQLTLGRLCLRNQLWGQARDHFKKSLGLQPTPEAYAELARLLAHLGETETSLETYKQGLLQYAGQPQ